jgi:hypothetical protein
MVVAAFMQDPRKEILPMRGLFTQAIALRLRSRDEVATVLGDGVADAAPAHGINPNEPGTGYVIEEDGSTVRVRADHWLLVNPLCCRNIRVSESPSRSVCRGVGLCRADRAVLALGWFEYRGGLDDIARSGSPGLARPGRDLGVTGSRQLTLGGRGVRC